LGWAADSFWSYFSVEGDLPYPPQPETDDEDEEQDDLFLKPAELKWCVICGKKHDHGAGDNCGCEVPLLREIKIFHRQCPSNKRHYLYSQEKHPLMSCPNCSARNGSGLEPVRRFQESDDETGLAMAIPFAHFQVTPQREARKAKRKLLCFTVNRQRAAAFPALLQEETFAHEMGRKIVELARKAEKWDLMGLGERLAEIADPLTAEFDPDFFLPVSRLPDEDLDAKGKRDLWLAETFAYFGIPDSARESAEDLGLVAVEYALSPEEKTRFREFVSPSDLSMEETTAL